MVLGRVKKVMKQYFENITDPRQAWKVEHSLLEIIMMTICAVMSGCEYWEDIVDFSRVKQDWFRQKLGLALENGIASHDTFQRVFQLIKPEELEKSFLCWVRSIAQKTKGEIISIDGKTVCGGCDAKTKAIHAKTKAIHMVSAWADANQLVLGQVKTDEKSNEITAIPKLLELLEIKDCIVTIDAMGCQRDIAEKIVQQEADYVFSLKGNQTSLHEDVRLYFEAAMKTPQIYAGVSSHTTRGKAHGRVERRCYWLSTDIDWLAQKGQWEGINSIGMVQSRVDKNALFYLDVDGCHCLCQSRTQPLGHRKQPALGPGCRLS